MLEGKGLFSRASVSRLRVVAAELSAEARHDSTVNGGGVTSSERSSHGSFSARTPWIGSLQLIFKTFYFYILKKVK